MKLILSLALALVALNSMAFAKETTTVKQYVVEFGFKENGKIISGPKVLARKGHTATSSSTITNTISNSSGGKIEFTTGQGATITILATGKTNA